MRLISALTITAALALTLPVTAEALVTDFVQNDAHSSGDAGDAWHTPTIVTPGMHAGSVYPVDDPQDWYGFDVKGPFRVALRPAPLLCDTLLGFEPPLPRVSALELAVYDSNGARVASTGPVTGCGDGPGGEEPAALQVNPHTGGVWRVVVRYHGALGTDLVRTLHDVTPGVPLAGAASAGPGLPGDAIDLPQQTSSNSVVTRYLMELDPCDPGC